MLLSQRWLLGPGQRIARPWVLACYLVAIGWTLPLARAAQEAPAAVDASRFEKQVLVPACEDPQQLVVTGEGNVLFIERLGAVKHYRAATGATTQVGSIPVAVFGEVGLMGLAIRKDFGATGHLYVMYCPAAAPETIRISRFTLNEDQLALESEQLLLDYPIDMEGAIHMGGGLWFDAQDHLWIGTGDNSPPIPELPVDQRPGRHNFDALRTSGDTQDLRGAILRIRPTEDGYSIPEGNLFDDPQVGRPEIFAMGCRNPFRFAVDDATGWLVWGDVGPNIQLDLQLGPNGYDEWNLARQAGNFGWPMFVGPNEAYRWFDFERREVGEAFQVDAPENRSVNNTGIERLPPPQPALVWYPSGPSDRFPTLGSGGRSAMAGPRFHFDPQRVLRGDADLQLPEAFDGAWFVYDWTRNWIQTLRLSSSGELEGIEPFLPSWQFRKPIDLKLGPEGALYLIEYGDQWSGNTDAQISRILYRRGNRPPMARLSASVVAGPAPLEVTFDAGSSSDPDGDQLRFQWQLDGRPVAHRARQWTTTLTQPGRYQVTVSAHDASSGSAPASLVIDVGNTAPEITLRHPSHGSFFDWGEPLRYDVQVADVEDGDLGSGTIDSQRIVVTQTNQRRLGTAQTTVAGDWQFETDAHPGLQLMRNTTCFSCHTTQSASAGPAYRQVGIKYAATSDAREKLAAKIIQGGTGVWGSKPMPPHPQHTLDETRLMVDWILSLAHDSSTAPVAGHRGWLRAPEANGDFGILALTAEYTDNGNDPAQPIRRADSIILHPRRKSAVFFDEAHRVDLVDVFEHQGGMVARLKPASWIRFREMNLADIDRIRWRLAAAGHRPLRLSVHQDTPSGPLIAATSIEPSRDELGDVFHEVVTRLEPTSGVHDVVIVLEGFADDSATDLEAPTHLSLSWLEFLESPEAIARQKQAAQDETKILLLATALDHPWATHMYSEGCRILAACLNQQPNVQAIVCPDLDWPQDPRWLEDVDAIVYYSRPAGDLLFSSPWRDEAQKLLDQGVGLVAIHWATGAELDVGPRYQEALGGWFNFAHSGLKVDRLPLVQVEPEHPICRGWDGYVLRDEFYLDLKFAADAQPLVQVTVDGTPQTVAWVKTRADGGRSFGTTLGHFHDNFSVPDFRRLLVGGILWSAGAEIPLTGPHVEVAPDLLTLPPQVRPIVKEYTLADLFPAFDEPLRGRSFARGRQLFESTSCQSCHAVRGTGGNLGPDLTAVRVRLAATPNPRGVLLREIVEPSAHLAEGFETEVLQLVDGQVVSGLVRWENDDRLGLANDPNQPQRVVEILRDEIEARQTSKTSLMPVGLVNTLTLDEIADLVAYVEAGGDPNYVAFMPLIKPTESWTDPRLSVRAGLELWLDASAQERASRETGLRPPLPDQPASYWLDGSGYRHHAEQALPEAQPRWRAGGGDALPFPCFDFDGVDDHLRISAPGRRASEFTAFLVGRVRSNAGGFRTLVTANAFGQNDYQSAFTIDLNVEATQRFSRLNVEGPGFGGLANLRTAASDFEQPFHLSIVNRVGPQGVRVWLQGQEEGQKDRQGSTLQWDQLTLGARYFSNTAQPPYHLGFLDGQLAEVLLYARALSDEECREVEHYLREKYGPSGFGE